MKNQSGRSLFEMIVVIGIVGLLTITAISGLGGGTANMKANALQYDIEEMAKRIIELNAWNRDGTFDSCDVDRDEIANEIDAKLDNDNCKLTTPVLNEKVCNLLMSKPFTNVECENNCNCDGDVALTFVVQ